ncbi:MAG: hypothetical protein MI747_20010, partial [Desulfobacterales bacterium]|nr:hypothetical protein [Desulfobacterales bacterium]
TGYFLFRYHEVWKQIFPFLVCSGAMVALVVVGSGHVWSGLGLSVKLACSILAGVVIYTGLQLAFNRRQLRDIWSFFR